MFALSDLPRELDARSEAAEASGFEARGRAGRDHSAIVGPDIIDGAREAPWHGDVEGGASCARVLQKAPTGWMGVENRQPVENLLTPGEGEHSRIVGDE